MNDQNQELPARRRIERRELISVFAALAPSEEITREELRIRTGLDYARPGDRSLIYQVSEHCRDVLGFVVQNLAGRFRRASDADVVNAVVPRRQERVYRQAARGVAETSAINDFGALDHASQARLLAHQSILGAVATITHYNSTELIANRRTNAPLPASIEAVLAAAAEIK